MDDHVIDRPLRKSTGALMVAIALGITAVHAPMPWWEATAIAFIAGWGLHKAAGLKIKWSYRDW